MRWILVDKGMLRDEVVVRLDGCFRQSCVGLSVLYDGYLLDNRPVVPELNIKNAGVFFAVSRSSKGTQSCSPWSSRLRQLA